MVIATGLTGGEAQAQCCAGPPPNDVTDFAILYEGDPHSLDFGLSSPSTVIGNIGIGDTGGFTGGSGSISGTIFFAGAQGNVSFNPGDVSYDGVSFSSSRVATDIAALNSLSQGLSTETGTPIRLTGDATLTASRGFFDGHNFVFTATEVSFRKGSTFTINGTSSDFVVINIPASAATDGVVALNGRIVLTGGITPDHVVFNLTGGDYSTLSGGDALLIDTGDLVKETMGTFLDPNGALDINESLIFGRVFGGDTTDMTFDDSTLIAPPPFAAPEPSSLALLGSGLIALVLHRRRRTLRR